MRSTWWLVTLVCCALSALSACAVDDAGETGDVESAPAADAAPTAPEPTAPDVGKLGLGAACETDADCESAQCFTYGKGKRCTHDCSPGDEARCPLGCNKWGVCRLNAVSARGLRSGRKPPADYGQR